MTPSQLYEIGDLKGAIAAAIEEVKKTPMDTSKRGFLCELLCFNGDLERADQQLDTIGKQDAKAVLGLALFRQLIRAEQARQQFYSDGRLPEFLGEPTPALRLYLEASIAYREGNLADAARLLGEAEEARPHVSGSCNGHPIDDLRDLDDRTAGFFEVLTSTGKYYWVPIERVRQIEIKKPERPRDLLWLQASMTVSDGPEGDVYLPTIYAGTLADPDEKARLGRVTDWKGGDAAPVTGIGLRTYLVGDEAKTVLELSELELAAGA
jgi:type VI secretion system protein ImpE